ncbi:alpha/beta-hydrolase [Meredithblackwellia eburnea MCA 4105]
MIVTLPSGQVRGFEDTCAVKLKSVGLTGEKGNLAPVRKWLGVPYASAGRWERPGEVKPWNGVRDCLEFGPAAPQPSSIIQDLLKAKQNPGSVDRSNLIPMSEDCQVCNIFAPSSLRPGLKVPVMVWIHGGALTTGRTDDFLYDPSQLVRDAEAAGKPIIVVTVTYRVNILGWLSHPDLSASDPLGCSGNWGWYDQLACLRWIQSNIHLFGGDKTRVTIFGESAGGVSVVGMATRRVRSDEVVFQRGICQSGVPFTMAARPEGYNGWERLLAHFNIVEPTPQARVAALRKVSWEDLIAFLPTVPPAPTGWVWTPTIEAGENATWPLSPGGAFAAGKWDPAVEELLIGNTGDEGTLFLGRYGITTAAGLDKFLDALFPEGEVRNEGKALYPARVEDESLPLAQKPASKLVGDSTFDGPAIQFLRTLATVPNATTGKHIKAYAYTLRQSFPDLIGNPIFACHHILDVPLVMRTISLWPKGGSVDRTSEEMAKAWFTFAQGEGLPQETFPAYSSSSPVWHVFAEGGTTVLESIDEFRKNEMDFWVKRYDERAAREKVVGWQLNA